MVKKKLTQLLAVSAIGFVGFGGQAFACSTAAWESGAGKAVGVADGASSYEGACALDAASGTVRQASKINGSGDTYVRFYVFAESGASGTIFQSGTLKAELSGGALKVGGKSTGLAPKQWHQVQLQIKPATTKVWVDNKVEITDASGLAKVEEVVFGGATGKVFVDAVAVSNNDPIGDAGVSIGSDKILVPGDVNGQSTAGKAITVSDVTAIVSVYTTKKPGKGVADCNLDGKITVSDVSCVVSKYK